MYSWLDAFDGGLLLEEKGHFHDSQFSRGHS